MKEWVYGQAFNLWMNTRYFSLALGIEKLLFSIRSLYIEAPCSIKKVCLRIILEPLFLLTCVLGIGEMVISLLIFIPFKITSRLHHQMKKISDALFERGVFAFIHTINASFELYRNLFSSSVDTVDTAISKTSLPLAIFQVYLISTPEEFKRDSRLPNHWLRSYLIRRSTNP